MLLTLGKARTNLGKLIIYLNSIHLLTVQGIIQVKLGFHKAVVVYLKSNQGVVSQIKDSVCSQFKAG